MKAKILSYCFAVVLLMTMQLAYSQNKGETKGEDKSASQAYAELLQTEASIKAEIESINSMLPSLNSSKAKKASKRLLELDGMLESIQLRKSYYPESAVNPSNQQQKEQARSEVRKIIEEKVLARGGSMDDDDENVNTEVDAQPQYWTIIIAMSNNPDKSKYQAYGDVDVEYMGGKYVFFVGSYSSKSAADAKCKQIIKKGKYRDAFVVKRGE